MCHVQLAVYCLVQFQQAVRWEGHAPSAGRTAAAAAAVAGAVAAVAAGAGASAAAAA